MTFLCHAEKMRFFNSVLEANLAYLNRTPQEGKIKTKGHKLLWQNQM